MSSATRIALVVLVLVAVGGVCILWRRQPHPTPALAPAPSVALPVLPVAPRAAPPQAPPAIRHPIGPATPTPGPALPALDDSDGYLKGALDDLLGRKAVLSFLALDGIARRFVATVSNLATDNAASQMWPIIPTAGHFATQPGGTGTVISPQNADRYASFVRFVDGIDTQRAVSLYMTVYPVLQHAYEDLGFPGRYLNDRVVEVIDHLLATPDVSQPIQVRLVTVDGATKPAGAGGLYVFADPALEASSSGQKILLRVGRENAGKLKAKLSDIRARIATAPGPR